MRYAQLVIGPAGSGKSTYCSNAVRHGEVLGRQINVVNLDPACEAFDYPVIGDIRELIDVEDVMSDPDLKFGPNGGLVFCMEYFAKNFEWLEEILEQDEDDYTLFDCPGQIELYTHLPVMRQLVDRLQYWNFRVCAVFCIDSHFMVEATKFISGIMSALSAMVTLEIPHVNIMTKIDLLSKSSKKDLERFLDPDAQNLLLETSTDLHLTKFEKLNGAIATLINDYSLVTFHPVDYSDEESLTNLFIMVDNAIQYGEDVEPKMKTLDEDDNGDDDDGDS